MKKLLLSFFLASNLFARTPLARFYVEPKSDKEGYAIALRFAVEKRTGNGIEVIVPKAQKEEFLSLAPNAKVIENDLYQIFQQRDLENPNWRAGYHDWDSVQLELKQVAKDHSDIATLEEYGKSVDGRSLLALRLTGKALRSTSKPELLITSSTHGNEITTVELTMGLIQNMVHGYHSNDRITAMLDKHTIYFIPVVCPDGYVNEDRYTNGVDPNREYPYPTVPNRNPNAAIANEMKWFHTKNIAGSMDIHADASMVMYPWAYTNKLIPDSDLKIFKPLAALMAEPLGYPSGDIAHIIYIAPGSSADYWYWKTKSISFGIEIDGDTNIASIIKKNSEMTYRFIEHF